MRNSHKIAVAFKLRTERRQFGRTMDGRCEFSFLIRNTLGSWKNTRLAFRQVLLDHELPGFLLYSWKLDFSNNEHSIEIKQIYLYHLPLSHFIELWRFLRTLMIKNFRALILKRVHSLKAKRLYLSDSCKIIWCHCNESKPKITWKDIVMT